MIPDREIPLPVMTYRFATSDKLFKNYIRAYLKKNHRGWKPIKYIAKKNAVLCRWEGLE